VFLTPFSFLPIQIRIADALLPLSIIFGFPVIIGLSLGTLVANIFGGLGFIDIIGGTIANFIATYVAWKLGKNKKVPFFVAIACQIIIISIIVGILSIIYKIFHLIFYFSIQMCYNAKNLYI